MTWKQASADCTFGNTFLSSHFIFHLLSLSGFGSMALLSICFSLSASLLVCFLRWIWYNAGRRTFVCQDAFRCGCERLDGGLWNVSERTRRGGHADGRRWCECVQTVGPPLLKTCETCPLTSLCCTRAGVKSHVSVRRSWCNKVDFSNMRCAYMQD